MFFPTDGLRYAIKSFHRKDKAHETGLKNEGDVKKEAEVQLVIQACRFGDLFRLQ